MSTDFWNGTGNWSTPGDWTPDLHPPGPTENAEIQTGTANLTSATTIVALQVDAPAILELTTGGTLVATGTAAVAGDLQLSGGGSANITGGLSLTGSGEVWLDSPFNDGDGGSSLNIGGTLTVSSTNGNALYIGTTNITTGDTLTAGGLSNSSVIQVVGNGTVYGALEINGAAVNSDAMYIDASGEVVMGAGDVYTQAAGATNIASGGTLAGTANVTGGSLDGTGTVLGTVNDISGGTVFGGPSVGTPGTLTVNGTYNQSGTGDLEANIGSGGTSSGVVTVSGGFVNLSGGTLSVSSTPAVGTVLTVMTFGPGHLAGQFAAVKDGASIGDGSFVNLGDGTSIEVFYNEDGGNIQIERVNNASLATTYTWIDGTANWSTAADWSGAQAPNSTGNVVIGNTSTGNVTLNGSTGDATVNSLSIAASNALTVSSVTLTSANGISVAAGATLSLSSGEINGSVLSGAGLLQSVSGNNALAADTISAGTSFIGQDSTITELLGAIDNVGSIEQIGGNGQNGILDVVSPVTLSGGGTLTLDTIATNGGNAYLEGSGQTLTSNNTIQGTGIIGNGNLALINSGLIDATPESGTSTLTINTSGEVTNTGTMKATGGATLVIGNPLVDNANGNITVVGTSTVELLNSTVQGGTLNNSGGGTLETVSSAELDGSTQRSRWPQPSGCPAFLT
jgi:fibronectin-binding autotransporter adhesin